MVQVRRQCYGVLNVAALVVPGVLNGLCLMMRGAGPVDSSLLSFGRRPLGVIQKGPFWVTRAIGLLPSNQWNFSFPAVIPGGEMPPVDQTRSG